MGKLNQSIKGTPLFPNVERVQPKAAKVEQSSVFKRGPVRAVLSPNCGIPFSERDTRKQNVRFGKACACVWQSHSALGSSLPVCICNAHRKEKHGKSNWREFNVPC